MSTLAHKTHGMSTQQKARFGILIGVILIIAVAIISQKDSAPISGERVQQSASSGIDAVLESQADAAGVELTEEMVSQIKSRYSNSNIKKGEFFRNNAGILRYWAPGKGSLILD